MLLNRKELLHKLNSFVLQITVVLLNIFFGIIIDTFGKLRNLKVERELDQANKCYICGVDVHDFVKKGSSSVADRSFKQHRQQTHNLWYYLYFAMHIWQQHRDQDCSVEMHVRECMERGDISWFPIGISDSNMFTSDTQQGKKDDAPADSLQRSEYLRSGDSGGDRRGGAGSMREDFDRLSETLSDRLGKMQESLSGKRNGQMLPLGFPGKPEAESPTVLFRKKLASSSSPPPPVSPPSAPTAGNQPDSPLQHGGSHHPYLNPLDSAELAGIISSCVRREIEPIRRQVAALMEK